MKKYVKYFSINSEAGFAYTLLQSELPFSVKEGIEHLKEKYPKAKIKSVPKRNIIKLDMAINVNKNKKAIE